MKTIEIDDRLFAEAREFAAEEGRSVATVVEDALREVLSRRRTNRRGAEEHNRITLPARGEGGLQPGIDLDNSASLWDLMDHSDAAS